MLELFQEFYMEKPRLKILLLLIEPPLPFGNAASRWFHVLTTELLKRGHKLDVLVASNVPTDIEKARVAFKSWPSFAIFPFAQSQGLLSKITTFLYPQRFSFNQDFLNRLQALDPNSYDVIHAEQTWSGWPVLPWAHKTLINVHFLQAIDLAEVRPLGLKQRLQFQSWFRGEKYLLSRFPNVRTCSDRLTKHILSWGPKPLLKTVPFGIDLSLYPFIETAQRQNREPLITLIGNMSWHPSYSAGLRLIEELWPTIKKRLPQARLRIVGWGARQAFHRHLHHPDIEIVENVPDIRPYFEEASLLLYAPGRGSGMKIKIQEALAFGVPVVTTSEGAEGLPAQDMVHLGLCDDNSGLIERAVQILGDFELQEKLRKKGRQLLEDHCSPASTVDQIEELHQQIASPSPQRN